MKNYNKILEAINRGILLALDDIEDQNDIQLLTHSKIKSKEYTKEYLEFNKYFIDLGLPSGTLWGKYNLGANIENPEKPEDLFGDYYAWGEIIPNKEKYISKTYKYILNDKLIKYRLNPMHSYDCGVDHLKLLLPEDDIVTLTFNGNTHYHIPTMELFKELCEYTTIEYDYDQEYDSHAYILTSKTNGKKIGFYATGFQLLEFRKEKTNIAGIWTSTLDDDDDKFAYRAHFQMISDNPNLILDLSHRYYGYVIRPVYN